MDKHQVSRGVGSAYQAALTLLSGPPLGERPAGREGILGLAGPSLFPDGGMMRDT